MFLNRTVTLTTVALFTLTRSILNLRTSFVQFPDKIVDLVINFIIFLLPEFFDKRLASWNTENIYQTPIHDLEELKLRIT
jgi:hypothetical protein